PMRGRNSLGRVDAPIEVEGHVSHVLYPIVDSQGGRPGLQDVPALPSCSRDRRHEPEDQLDPIRPAVNQLPRAWCCPYLAHMGKEVSVPVRGWNSIGEGFVPAS